MDFSFFESLLFGLVSGLAEFLPVSAQAHRQIMLKLFGAEAEVYLLSLFVHLGAFAALITANTNQLHRIRREQRLASVPKRRRKRQPDKQTLLDIQVVKTAFVPILLGLFIYQRASGFVSNLMILAGVLLVNGIILFIPTFMSMGNKDSRTMSRLDSIFVGLAGILWVIPGISRIGVTTTAAIGRGADRQQALNWSLLLSIPALILLMGLDLYSMILYGVESLSLLVIVQYILSAAAAYCGAYFAIITMRFMAVNTGYTGFAYYSWGTALFAFILYMYT